MKESKKNVLIVEDEAFVGMLLKIELENNGFEVCDIVSTSEMAISCTDREKIDIIIMDIRLVGEVDGIETSKIIKHKHEIPIIFITGYNEVNLIERAKEIKPFGIFIKPVDIDELIDLIDTI